MAAGNRVVFDGGVSVACHVPGSRRHAVAAILDEARNLPAAFVVMGSHGHGAFYELLAGSTTHGVLHRTPCPVVIVPTERPDR